MKASSSSSHLRSFAAVAICAFAYLYVFPYQSRINNPNENVRFYMTAALVEQGTYAIDTIRDRWGWVNDAAVYGGHVYSVKAPGTSLLGVPGYAAYLYAVKHLERPFDRSEALWVCRFTASIVPTLVWLFFFYRWLAKRSRHPLLKESVFYSVALGSLLYGYGLLFVSHTLSAAMAFSAFVILYGKQNEDARHMDHRSAFFAGLLSGAVTFFEYPGLVCSALLAMYGLWVIRPFNRLWSFGAGGLLPALAMGHFQWRAFGNAFTPGHMMVENEALRAAHHRGFFGAEGPSWEALYGLIVDPAAGLIPLTPILAFALLGVFILLSKPRERTPALVTCLITLTTTAAICSMNNWRGGWTVGPRYLALLVPFLGWAALEGLESIADRLPGLAYSLALGCTAVALLASGVPSAYYPHLPPELTRPLPQLFALLIEHGYAPPNAGALLGVYGTPSMLPVLGAGLLALGMCFSAIKGTALLLKTCLGSLLIAGTLSWPLVNRPSEEPGVSAAVAFITRRWMPEGHDLAATLKVSLDASPGNNHEVRNQLVDVYRKEGRYSEATRVRRGIFQKRKQRY